MRDAPRVKNFTPTGLISGWKSILAFVVCALEFQGHAVAQGRGKAADAVLIAATDDDRHQLAAYPLLQRLDAPSKWFEAHELDAYLTQRMRPEEYICMAAQKPRSIPVDRPQEA